MRTSFTLSMKEMRLLIENLCVSKKEMRLSMKEMRLPILSMKNMHAVVDEGNGLVD